jgi:hypothetical protein
MRFIMSMVTNQFPTPGARFFITSYGNGWAYEVEELHSGRTLFFQDSDACTLRHDSAEFMDEGHIALLFECLDYEAEPMCEFDTDARLQRMLSDDTNI